MQLTMNKPVLMIHEVCESIFNIDRLDKYILTFDDALYTQFMYFDRICNIDTDKIFFVSTGIVSSPGQLQSDKYIKCDVAHELFRKNKDTKHYMNWEQISIISRTKNCTVGGHSHEHLLHESNIPYKYIVTDTNTMIKEFKHNLGSIPTSFCFPYNNSSIVYEEYLNSKGFNQLYGTGRVDVDELI